MRHVMQAGSAGKGICGGKGRRYYNHWIWKQRGKGRGIERPGDDPKGRGQGTISLFIEYHSRLPNIILYKGKRENKDGRADRGNKASP